LLRSLFFGLKNHPLPVILYTTEKDFFSYQSETFNSVCEAGLFCQGLGITKFDWIEINDCPEFCNLDWIAPVRRKGRETGTYCGDIYEKSVNMVFQERL
jgi:hypothetical protein